MKYEEFHRLHKRPQIPMPDHCFRRLPRENGSQAWIAFFEELKESSKDPIDRRNMDKGLKLVNLAIECGMTHIIGTGHTVCYGLRYLRYIEFEMVFSCIDDEANFNFRLREIE